MYPSSVSIQLRFPCHVIDVIFFRIRIVRELTDTLGKAHEITEIVGVEKYLDGKRAWRTPVEF